MRIRSCVQADSVDGLHVWVEETPILLHILRLLVLVEHGEEIRLDGVRVPWRAPSYMLDQVFVVDLRVLR